MLRAIPATAGILTFMGRYLPRGCATVFAVVTCVRFRARRAPKPRLRNGNNHNNNVTG